MEHVIYRDIEIIFVESGCLFFYHGKKHCFATDEEAFEYIDSMILAA